MIPSGMAYSEQPNKDHDFEMLIKALASSDSDTRANAAQALGDIGDQRAVGMLTHLLSDVEVYPRLMAAEGLGKLGDRRAVLPLIEALKDPVAKVRGFAAVALGDLGDKLALSQLRTILIEDPEEVNRGFAADALGKLHDKQAVTDLVQALVDPDIDVRWYAIRALAEIGSEEAIPALRQVQQAGVGETVWGDAPNTSLQDAATKAIKQIQSL